jgi:hypothetical protein
MAKVLVELWNMTLWDQMCKDSIRVSRTTDIYAMEEESEAVRCIKRFSSKALVFLSSSPVPRLCQ